MGMSPKEIKDFPLNRIKNYWEIVHCWMKRGNRKLRMK
jgi:hypothetical protein